MLYSRSSIFCVPILKHLVTYTLGLGWGKNARPLHNLYYEGLTQKTEEIIEYIFANEFCQMYSLDQ